MCHFHFSKSSFTRSSFFAVLAALVILAGCSRNEYIDHNDPLPQGIHSVSFLDGNPTIILQQGSEARIEWGGWSDSDNNDITYNDHHLTISEGFGDFVITLPEVDDVLAGGNAQVYLRGFDYEQFDVLITENATVFLEETQEVATGIATKQQIGSLNLRINENGTLEGFGAEVADADVFLEMNGTARVEVNEVLKVAIPANGTVEYKGSPTIESELGFQAKLIDAN